jgi:class 3 adenylate cyclase
MPHLTRLAAIPIEDTACFELLSLKLSKLPAQLGEREANLYPAIMLITDLLRSFRRAGCTPSITFLLEQSAQYGQAHSRLLIALDAGGRTDPSSDPPELPSHLRSLISTYSSSPLPMTAAEAGTTVLALPLKKTPDSERVEVLIKSLNQPTREQLMADLEREKQKAKDVLHKIFPASVVEQLENGVTTIYDYYPSTSILFSDMVGFTTLSKGMDARELVTFIDSVFQQIDQLCIKHGVEKIKTIGDSYMAAAGLPQPCDNHAERIANLAMDIQELHRDLSNRSDGVNLDARIGIHSGPVVAGVIGMNKFAFDLWGDTVNVASRMESTGIPGEIQVSIATRELLPANFITHIRGHVAMKGHSSIETFLLRGR